MSEATWSEDTIDDPPPLDIKPVSIEEEMKRSYLAYAMSVIVSRAIPDVARRASSRSTGASSTP